MSIRKKHDRSFRLSSLPRTVRAPAPAPASHRRPSRAGRRRHPRHSCLPGRGSARPCRRTRLPVSPSPPRGCSALLERRSPALGGLLAERLWFRLPASPAAAAGAARTPPRR